MSEENVLRNVLHDKKLGLLYELSLGVKKKQKIVFFLIPACTRAIKSGEQAEVWGLAV